MSTYTIRDLEKISGIKAHTIRIWEKRYNIIAPTRTATNIRNYCDTELKKLLNISLLNRNGLKISKLAKLSNDEINEKINQLIQSYTDAESLVENLTIAMVELDQGKVEKVLSRAIMQLGFEETIIKILYPFLVKIGVMWQTGIINPVQEHFITNLFRKKLMVAIDALITANNPNSKRFVLFLPEGEYHELGLLFFYYLVKRRGHQVIYLGQSVPFNDLIETKKLKPVNYLVTAFISFISGKDISKYAKALAEQFAEQKIYLSGSQTDHIQDKLPGNIKIISSPADFRDELNKIAPF
jgi:DNA-binding transcriptional MerR regulator